MNIIKPPQDCYESPNPDLDFDQINDKYIPGDPFKKDIEQTYTIYKKKPEKTDGYIETDEERLNRLKAELFDLKEEVLVGIEFWDLLGGKGTYDDLLKVFEEAGLELYGEIDKKMKGLNCGRTIEK